ncbi:hypothetical protein D6D54_08795 [Spiroplasma poulsonii]|uniref:Uncharacterized protein n=1 Tax=Spiroplasma poulsonii TaxID=2138 RepID=A0A3S0ZV14_9MOLU|nr:MULTISPECIES: hypothetical protein [Spiroplasma]MBH8623449.1 hypothetical protein [Spiroplasma sp. hyd1]MBW3058791.1 hypothetical protein [Spiroplasma poulsonii]RUP75280.1 hypothetical protein D6D54_08795 [Spiroplasma poulsonii]
MDNDQIAKLASLDRNIFLTKTKNRQYLEEKKALTDNLKLMCEKCIELHTQGTTDPNRKKERIKLIKNFIN